MYSDFYNEKNEYFSIIAVSLLFHIAVVVALLIAVWLRPAKETPPPIPFFEMVNLAPPPPAPPKPIEKPPEPIAETVPEPVAKPEPKLEPKPIPKPEPPKQESKPKPATPAPPAEPTPPKPQMDMSMPDTKDMPMIETVDYLPKDPQVDTYLSTVYRLILERFKPPPGTEISKDEKTTVHFKIARNGEISEVVLRSSSKNGVWDRLAVRAVELAKLPPIPPVITDESLLLKIHFRELK